MTNKIVQLLPIVIIVAALLVSMYLVFNTSSILAADSDSKKIVAGASCVVPEIDAVDTTEEEIHFVGCGGFF